MSIKPYKNKKGELVPKAWLINCYPAGRKGKQVLKVVHDCTEAHAKQMELALIRQHLHQVTPHDPLVRDVVQEWLQHYSLDHSMSTLGDIQRAMLRLLPHFGKWHLSRLTLPLFEEYMRKRQADTWRPPIKNPDPTKTYAPAKPVGKARINTELKYMGMLIKYCVEKKYMMKPPFDVPKFRKLKQKRPTLPTVAEVEQLLPHLHQDAYLAVLLYHDAGLRKMEGLLLKAEDVYLEEEIIRVVGKGNKERTVPIVTDRLYAALQERAEKIPSGYLIVNPRTGEPYKDLRKAIENAAEKAGMKKNVYNHLFRHAFATHSLEAGVDLVSVQENLGHADLSTTRVYAQARLGHRMKESKKLKEYLSRGKGKPPTSGDQD